MAARWSKWPDLVGSDGGARDYGSQRRCESNLVSYGGLVVVEGRHTVGLDWRLRARGRQGSRHVFFFILDVFFNFLIYFLNQTLKTGEAKKNLEI